MCEFTSSLPLSTCLSLEKTNNKTRKNMAHFRVLGALGYGVFTLLVVNNVDGAGEYLSELGRTTVHFLSRSKDRITNAASSTAGDFSQLTEKIDRLSQMNRETVHVHHGPNGAPTYAASWITTIIGGTVVTVLVFHFTGLFDMSSYLYVTQAKFKVATEALERGVKHVGEALAKTRIELMQKLGVVEKNLDITRKELKTEIQVTSQEIRKDVKLISTDIRHLHTDVATMDGKLDGLHDGVSELRAAVEHANRGIALLCHVVAESFFTNRSSGGADGRKPQQDKALMDLMSFTKTNPMVSNGEVLKQIKFNAGEGPIMRLMSALKEDKPRELLERQDSSASTAAFVEKLSMQLNAD